MLCGSEWSLLQAFNMFVAVKISRLFSGRHYIISHGQIVNICNHIMITPSYMEARLYHDTILWRLYKTDIVSVVVNRKRDQ